MPLYHKAGLNYELVWQEGENTLTRYHAFDARKWVRFKHRQPAEGRSTAHVRTGSITLSWPKNTVVVRAGEHTYNRASEDVPPRTSVGYDIEPGSEWYCLHQGMILPTESRQAIYEAPNEVRVPAGALLFHVERQVRVTMRRPNQAETFACFTGWCWLVAPR